MKVKVIFLLTLILVTSIISCDLIAPSESELVGTWVGSDQGTDDATGDTIVMNSDGTMTHSSLPAPGGIKWESDGSIVTFNYYYADASLALTISMEYNISGNKLTLINPSNSSENAVYIKN